MKLQCQKLEVKVTYPEFMSSSVASRDRAILPGLNSDLRSVSPLSLLLLQSKLLWLVSIDLAGRLGR